MYQLKPRQRTVIAAIMLLASFISLMSQTMVVTALPVVEAQLHQPLAVVQWLTTGYTLVIGIITPLSANLYEKYNNRQFFLAIIALFLGGTIVGCLATNFWTLLGARLIQAAAGGLLVSLQMTTLVTIFPPEKRGTIMGLSSLVVSFGPAIGPTLAGVILNLWGWRSIFWVVLPFMSLIWLIGFFALPAYTTPQAVKIDAWSVPLLLIGPGLTLASFTVLTTQVLVGSLMLIAGLVVSLLFYRRQQALPRPLLDFHVFNYRPFTMTLAIASLLFMILLSTEQMVSVFAQNSLHQSSALTGLIILPGAVVNALVGAVVGRLYDRHGIKALVWTGLSLCLITTIPTLCFTAHTPLWWLTVLYAGRMMAIGIAFSPLMSESYLGMAAKDISQATAMNNALRQMTGALAVTLVVVISSLPASSVTGMRWAMAVTFVFNLLAIGLFAKYLKEATRMANDLIRATAIINTTIRHQLDAALRPLGLSEVNYYYLLVVAEQPGINQADLTARIVRDQSTVTRQVDRLVKQGWLTKRQAPTDARQSALFLTPQAQAILPQLWAINQTVNETALASLTPAEQATLLNLLGKTFDGLSQDYH